MSYSVTIAFVAMWIAPFSLARILASLVEFLVEAVVDEKDGTDSRRDAVEKGTEG